MGKIGAVIILQYLNAGKTASYFGERLTAVTVYGPLSA